MEILTAPSKSFQIKEHLKDLILVGDLPEGARLDTVRSLAAKFSVSRQVIDSAFDLLEKDGLILRNGRTGVYVKTRLYPSDATVIFMLGYDVYPNNRYLNEIVKISCPPHLRENCSFLARVIPKKIATKKRLSAELSRVSQMPEIDCMLVVSPPGERDVVETLNSTRIPTIFIGDFASDINDIECNQISGDNRACAIDCVECLFENGVKNLVLLIGSLGKYFNVEFKDAAEKAVNSHGGSLRVMEVDYEDGPMAYERSLKSLFSSSGPTPDAFLNYGCHSGHLFEALEKRSHSLASNVRILALQPLDGTSVELAEIDFSSLFSPIFERVAELKANHSSQFRKEKVRLPIHFILRK